MKHDGLRIIAHKDDRGVRLRGSSGEDLSSRFPLNKTLALAIILHHRWEAMVCDDDSDGSDIKLNAGGAEINPHPMQQHAIDETLLHRTAGPSMRVKSVTACRTCAPPDDHVSAYTIVAPRTLCGG
jgi:hypothetical protein